jgi:formylglycine-generating enzyme required for sulfatase activity
VKLRITPVSLGVSAAFCAFCACSLFVDTGGLDTETDAIGPQEGGDVVPPLDASDASSDVSVDVAKDVAVEAEAGPCPPSGKGPDMIVVPGAGYCIDSTEVTRGQYAVFLASNPSTAGQPSECSWNANFTPNPWAPTPVNLPVVDVDWCDARAFCLWAGKRLCGAIGGGALSMSNNANPVVSQWYRACTANGTVTYPYGNTFNAASCNTANVDADIAPVKSFPGCNGGVPGLYDMSGNVEEWQDSCDNNNGANDNCREQAGTYDYDYNDPSGSARCDFMDSDLRGAQLDDVGFRCCTQ